ncbi:MAG: tetratricopeptide repeat protein [Gammaproteobacteria bacterium]|nr:tetratricopeptide repeat protein [Gammaproteobacteria bacterium]
MYSEYFLNSVKTYKHYIKASQMGTVRLDLDKTPATIKGLCTDGLSACVAIIVLSADKRRMSLTHTDLMVSTSAILKECEWAEPGCKVLIIGGVYHDNTEFKIAESFSKTTLPRITLALEEAASGIEIDMSLYNRFAWSVSIDRAAKIRPNRELGRRIGEAAPEIEIRHARNMFEANSLCHLKEGYYHDLDLQFDGEHWTEITPLLESSKNKLDSFKSGYSCIPPQLENDYKAYMEYESLALAHSISLNTKAVDLYKKEQFAAAAIEMKLALQLRIFARGDKHDEVRPLAINLGQVYFKLADYSSAHRYFQLALGTYTTPFSPEPDDITKLRNYIGRCRTKLGISAPVAGGSGCASAGAGIEPSPT